MFGLKEIMVIVTHSSLLFFVIINPSIQLLLLAIAYGQNLTDIKIYYTNNDHRKTSLHGVTYMWLDLRKPGFHAQLVIPILIIEVL